MDDLTKKALDYHNLDGKPGKIEVVPSKPCKTADDLSLAYTPGVAKAVLAIYEDENNAYKYTSKGNLVGVISNGTAILGLGNKGALASKPVMEGKGVLFKRFADIDVFDIELNETDPQKIIDIVKALEPTFGGINLEDIKAPECFQIEQTLIKECSIPIFHDDQHGTAIITTAGLINAVDVGGHDIKNIKVVFNGAGSAGISCAKMLVALGIPRSNIIMCDSKGVITKKRIDSVTPEKRYFATSENVETLEEAIKGAHVFIGLSVADCVTDSMIKSMAKKPIVFAMSNPNPEIDYNIAIASRNDIIMATGRSDYPNQINNVLGFPFIFRGALDVKSRFISEGMKMAASQALANLAREPISPHIEKAYGKKFAYGKEYIVPKPFDPRVIEWVAGAVALQASVEGLAQEPLQDIDAYKKSLRKRMEKYWV